MSHEFAKIIYFVSQFIQIIIFTLGCYLFGISLFGWFKRKESPAQDYPPEKRFAIIIPAHNEEKVIAHILDSLERQNYPKELFTIYVIADNCTDKTSKVSATNGAVVYERTNESERGKGYALEWMFKKILPDSGADFDAVCVFDADNLVSSNYLLEMNKHLCMGDKAIQGYLDSKNPFDSWITCSYSIAFWIANRIFQLPRYYLGLCCGISGTGFCIEKGILEQIGWGATCLTEDLEFTMKLALGNRKVTWAYNAVVYDEKPLTLKQSWNQRKRWMQGHVECAIRFLKPLLKKAFNEGDLIAFDCALYLFQPLRTIFFGFLTVMMWIQSLLPDSPIFSLRHVFPPGFWGTFVALQFIYGPAIVLIEKKFNINAILGFFIYPFYCLTWVPITIQGIFTWSRREWIHTSHTRDISIGDLEKAESYPKLE